MSEIEVGRVGDFFAKIGVAGIDLTAELQVGDTVHIKGHTTDISQAVESMEVENETVERAGPGVSIGMKVLDRCRRGDHVYKVTD